MAARTPSTFRLIGAGVTSVGALAAIFGAGGSNAQTLANLESDRAAYLQRQCGHIGDGAERVGCMAAKSIEFSRAQTEAADARAAAAKQTTAAANKGTADEGVLRTCLTYLREQRAGGKVFDRTITRENACAYARELGMRGGPG